MMASINMHSQNHIHHHHHNPGHRDHHRHQEKPTSNHHRKCLPGDFGPRSNDVFEKKHVVIVMNAMEEFSVATLEWVLKNIELDTCCTITLLGVKPWLSFVFSCKTETDIWTMNIKDLLSMRETVDWRNNIRCQKAQQLVKLCKKYGVAPQIRSEQGSPKRLLVLERIANACATWVVFDRHYNKKHIKYVARKVPCNILVMNKNGEADMIKGRSTNFKSNDESPLRFSTSTIPTPTLMLSDEYKRKLMITSP